jgi:hypothetical protein
MFSLTNDDVFFFRAAGGSRSKIFSSAWLDADWVACGTKGNKLLLVGNARRGGGAAGDLGGGTAAEGVVVVDLPRALSGTAAARRVLRDAETPMFGNHAVNVGPRGDVLVSATHDPSVLCAMSLPGLGPVSLLPAGRDANYFGCAFVGGLRGPTSRSVFFFFFFFFFFFSHSTHKFFFFFSFLFSFLRSPARRRVMPWRRYQRTAA